LNSTIAFSRSVTLFNNYLTVWDSLLTWSRIYLYVACVSSSLSYSTSSFRMLILWMSRLDSILRLRDSCLSCEWRFSISLDFVVSCAANWSQDSLISCFSFESEVSCECRVSIWLFFESSWRLIDSLSFSSRLTVDCKSD